MISTKGSLDPKQYSYMYRNMHGCVCAFVAGHSVCVKHMNVVVQSHPLGLQWNVWQFWPILGLPLLEETHQQAVWHSVWAIQDSYYWRPQVWPKLFLNIYAYTWLWYSLPIFRGLDVVRPATIAQSNRRPPSGSGSQVYQPLAPQLDTQTCTDYYVLMNPRDRAKSQVCWMKN